jgi:SAM-dependent methyltransferase
MNRVDMESQEPNDMKQAYSPGYSDPVVAFMRRRTAASHAAFFTPLLTPGMTLLDCGCGPGSITVDLARTVAPGHVIGIDQEPAQFTLAVQQASDEQLSVSFRQANVYELPFEPHSFDAAFAHGLFSHLKEPMRGFSEIRRVLKPSALIGLRDADWGGALTYPPDPVIESGVTQLRQMVHTSGGDPEVGRRLGGMLRDAGFHDVRMSASYEVYDPAFLMAYFARIAPEHRFSEEPFLAQPWCEAVGRA